MLLTEPDRVTEGEALCVKRDSVADAEGERDMVGEVVTVADCEGQRVLLREAVYEGVRVAHTVPERVMVAVGDDEELRDGLPLLEGQGVLVR